MSWGTLGDVWSPAARDMSSEGVQFWRLKRDVMISIDSNFKSKKPSLKTNLFHVPRTKR